MIVCPFCQLDIDPTAYVCKGGKLYHIICFLHKMKESLNHEEAVYYIEKCH